jgi:hypothetical protein
MLTASAKATKTVDPQDNGKPQYDPDAYDVVGRRG